MATEDHEPRSGLADAAGRAAFRPARAVARAWRDQLETAVDEVLSSPESARVIDRALAGGLPEEVARSIVRHRVLERMVAELAESGELQRMVDAALASPHTQQALRQVMASPAVRDALAEQTVGFVEEVAGSLRSSAVRLDDRVELRRRNVPTVYAGVVTRAIALATDVFLAIVLYMGVVGIVALVSSLVGGIRPEWLVGVLLTAGWFVVAGGYFVLFWSSTGQTPGMRLLHLRVRSGAGSPSAGRSVVRLVGLGLSIAVLFLGFVPVLFDARRRGLADFLAGTVVEYDAPASVDA